MLHDVVAAGWRGVHSNGDNMNLVVCANAASVERWFTIGFKMIRRSKEKSVPSSKLCDEYWLVMYHSSICDHSVESDFPSCGSFICRHSGSDFDAPESGPLDGICRYIKAV